MFFAVCHRQVTADAAPSAFDALLRYNIIRSVCWKSHGTFKKPKNYKIVKRRPPPKKLAKFYKMTQKKGLSEHMSP